MTSFIELPRLGFAGREQASLYVNVADIVSLEEQWDGQTKVEIRHRGSEGNTAYVLTYAPLAALLSMVQTMTAAHGAYSWSRDTLKGWSIPIAAALKDAAERERAVR